MLYFFRFARDIGTLRYYVIEQIIAAGGDNNKLSQQKISGKGNLRLVFSISGSENKIDYRIGNCHDDGKDAGLLPAKVVKHDKRNQTHEGKHCAAYQTQMGEKLAVIHKPIKIKLIITNWIQYRKK